MFPMASEMISGGLPIVVEQVTTSQGAGLTSTVNINVDGDNRCVLVFCSHRAAAISALSSVTLNGVAGTVIAVSTQDTGVANNFAAVVWTESELPSVAGDYELVQNWSQSDDTMAGVWCLSNVKQSNPVEDFVKAAHSQLGNNNTKTITLLNSVDLFVITAVSGSDDDGPYKSSGNFTHDPSTIEQYDLSSTLIPRFAIAGAYDDECASDSEDYSWTNTTGISIDAFNCIALSLNEA